MTTNYTNTFIAVADDCPVDCGLVPPENPSKPTIAAIQFSLLRDNPYAYTSDDLLFECYAIKNGVPGDQWQVARKQFFEKPQACLRASPLPKKYGWGIHHNNENKIALMGRETDSYSSMQNDPGLKVVKAMRSKR